MTSVFPDFPELSQIKSERSFSLPQQNYLLSQFLLQHCDEEAQRWLEGEYPAEEFERLSPLEKWERLHDYRHQLEYEQALDLFLEARKHLIAWGFEHLRKQPQTPPVMEILAKRNELAPV